ncbi:streptophobe family protein [Streptomyces sp. NPDC058001]|uniref:streptophobe family protein n=1 Tax=Streptomyces sp. NPDC058001 TaxID=3346300 RepID=UPI0036E6932E
MSQQRSPQRTDVPGAVRRAPHGWFQALVAVLATLVTMAVLAALGLWAAGASGLPDNAFPRVVVAVVLIAVGGSVDISGGAGALATTQGDLTVLPLSVTLAGALVMGAAFLRPLRHRAVAKTRELAGWAARVAVLWALALIGLSLAARQEFAVSTGNGTLNAIGHLLGTSPRVAFRADVPLTVVIGSVWLLGLFALVLLVSRSAPLPARLVRFQESVRPAAHAMVVLLLTYVAVALVVGLIEAASGRHPAETFAVLLLGLPNLAWLGFTLGLGVSWKGRVEGPFGLPMPHALDTVLRTPTNSTVNVRTLADVDGRAWWLIVVAAVALLAAAFLSAVRSPARVPAWRHAVRLAVALVVTVLAVCLLARVSAHYGLSLLGIGEVGGPLSAQVVLWPRWWTALGFAALWGLVAGFLGALSARRVRRHGEVTRT